MEEPHLQINCPHCGGGIGFTASQAGLSGPCPTCGNPMATPLPFESQKITVLAPGQTPPPPPVPQPQHSKSASGVRLLGLSCVAGLVIGAAGIHFTRDALETWLNPAVANQVANPTTSPSPAKPGASEPGEETTSPPSESLVQQSPTLATEALRYTSGPGVTVLASGWRSGPYTFQPTAGATEDAKWYNWREAERNLQGVGFGAVNSDGTWLITGGALFPTMNPALELKALGEEMFLQWFSADDPGKLVTNVIQAEGKTGYEVHSPGSLGPMKGRCMVRLIVHNHYVYMLGGFVEDKARGAEDRNPADAFDIIRKISFDGFRPRTNKETLEFTKAVYHGLAFKCIEREEYVKASEFFGYSFRDTGRDGQDLIRGAEKLSEFVSYEAAINFLRKSWQPINPTPGNEKIEAIGFEAATFYLSLLFRDQQYDKLRSELVNPLLAVNWGRWSKRDIFQTLYDKITERLDEYNDEQVNQIYALLDFYIKVDPTSDQDSFWEYRTIPIFTHSGRGQLAVDTVKDLIARGDVEILPCLLLGRWLEQRGDYVQLLDLTEAIPNLESAGGEHAPTLSVLALKALAFHHNQRPDDAKRVLQLLEPFKERLSNYNKLSDTILGDATASAEPDTLPN